MSSSIMSISWSISVRSPFSQEVWDQDGEVYLDFLGGYGALNKGHNPAPIIQTIQDAIGAPNILQASLNSLAAVLAENLAGITPGDLKFSFFCSRGTEAVVAALKMARAITGKSTLKSRWLPGMLLP